MTDTLPSLPHVAVEILHRTRDADVPMSSLAAIIETDPALAAKVLKVVNSSFFGLSRRIGSIQQALTMLGLRTVRVMVLSLSFVDSLRDGGDGGFDFEAYWRRSLGSAVAARLLARAVDRGLEDEAFVAGLLADLGMVAAWRSARDDYRPVLAAWARGEGSLAAVEARYLGTDHAALGGALLAGWGLPASLCEAVTGHHAEGTADAAGGLGSIVRCAAEVAALFCGELPASELDRVQRRCVAETGIGEGALEELFAGLEERLAETASLFSVPVGETVDYESLQAEAAARLAELTIQAEVDRLESSRRQEEAEVEARRLSEERAAILEIATTDGLTGLANRTAFDARLDEELARAGALAQPLSLILLDLDRFKAVNDTHGHQAGDAVLRSAAACMRRLVGAQGLAARYGGEEFAVILPGRDAQATRILAEDLRRAIAACEVAHGDRRLRVTVSLGCSCQAPGALPVRPADMVAEADRWLYRAKRAGRDRVLMDGS
ncbi:MAG: GGDEF domain-containing protein [Candidatus Krumholzibacteriota bacterium]|nr:GGDEF domain-containing protein [Candidatus Krumholzibacteriota bacterium]